MSPWPDFTSTPEELGDARPDSTSYQRWYARHDDTIGGWCILNVDKPPSEANHQEREYFVGSMWSRWHAEHIVALHNAWLDGDEDPTDRDI